MMSLQTRRILSALTAALLLGTALTACGSTAKETPATEISAPQFSLNLDLVELSERSEQIVSGTITAASEPFRVQAATGETSIFTDYTITVDQTFKGEAAETLTLRMEGGQIGDEKVVPDPDFGVAVDKEFIFFLYQPGAGYFNTDEDYYLPTGGGMGLFARTGEADAYQNALKDQLSTAGLPTLIGSNPTYSDEAAGQNLGEALGALLESGAITQEQYDAIGDKIDVYATRVTDTDGEAQN